MKLISQLICRKQSISFAFLPKRTCLHFELKETKNTTHFLLLKAHPHYNPWDQTNLALNLTEKSKTCFFTFLNKYVSWIEQDKILISQFSPPKFRHFADKRGPKGMSKYQMSKWILTFFRYKDKYHKQLELKK